MPRALTPLAAVIVVTACGGPWRAVRLDEPAALVDARAVRVRLRDGTRATLVHPASSPDGITCARVSDCAGPSCDALVRDRAVTRAALEPTAAATPDRPTARVDVDFAMPVLRQPVGVGLRGTIFGLGLSLRAAHVSGWGGGLAVTYAGVPDLSFGSEETALTPAWSDSVTIDATALHRLRLLGHDRRGLGLDLSLGPSLARLWWHAGHGAYELSGTCGGLVSFGGCTRTLVTPYDPPPRAFSDGWFPGVVAGVALDLRREGWVVGLAGTWHLVAGDLAPVHILSLALRAGFGVMR